MIKIEKLKKYFQVGSEKIEIFTNLSLEIKT